MEEYLNEQFTVIDLYRYFEELAGWDMTCQEALEQLADDYQQYLEDKKSSNPLTNTTKCGIIYMSSREGQERKQEHMMYAVINPNGTYAGVSCESLEEARDLMAQKEGRWIAELVPHTWPEDKEEKTFPGCFNCPYYEPDTNQCLYIGNVAPCEEGDFEEEEEDEYFWDMEGRL